MNLDNYPSPPFDWNKQDYTPVFEHRARLLEAIRNDHSGYTLAAFIKLYKKNPIAFIEDWGVTYNPRMPTMKTRPLILFPKQKEYVLWLLERVETQTEGLVEKSRDMGATWVAMAFAVWAWIFKPEFKVGFGSRKEDLVDRLGDNDSIFEKGRKFILHVPIEFKPKSFRRDLHMPHMRIMNPENGSSIIGESGNNIGRGGRSSMYIVDEYAHHPQDEDVEASLSENSDVKILISTPKGMNNVFARKRFGGNISVFTFNWWDNPMKTRAWYEEKKKTTLPHIFAQEIDIDYNASLESVAIPAKWFNAAVGFTNVERGVKRMGHDPADSGDDAAASVFADGWWIEDAKEYNLETAKENARKAWADGRQFGMRLLPFDSIGVGVSARDEFMRLQKLQGLKHKIRVYGVNVGTRKLVGWYKDEPYDEMFSNLRAVLYIAELRSRFQATYEHVNGIQEHAPEDMIGINPEMKLLNKLRAELCGVEMQIDDLGKSKIKSKKKMAKSPNLADALSLLGATPPALGFTKEEVSATMDADENNSEPQTAEKDW